MAGSTTASNRAATPRMHGRVGSTVAKPVHGAGQVYSVAQNPQPETWGTGENGAGTGLRSLVCVPTNRQTAKASRSILSVHSTLALGRHGWSSKKSVAAVPRQ